MSRTMPRPIPQDIGGLYPAASGTWHNTPLAWHSHDVVCLTSGMLLSRIILAEGAAANLEALPLIDLQAWDAEGRDSYTVSADCRALLAKKVNDVLIPENTGVANAPTEEEVRVRELDDYLSGVYAQVAAGDVLPAMDSVIEYIDNLLIDGLYAVCDELLRKADFERLPSVIRRAFLMMTLPAKDKLRERQGKYDVALKLLSKERGGACRGEDASRPRVNYR